MMKKYSIGMYRIYDIMKKKNMNITKILTWIIYRIRYIYKDI